jgi:hypothetical protein
VILPAAAMAVTLALTSTCASGYCQTALVWVGDGTAGVPPGTPVTLVRTAFPSSAWPARVTSTTTRS